MVVHTDPSGLYKEQRALIRVLQRLIVGGDDLPPRQAFIWPEQLRQVAIIALLVGLPIVALIAWYHGDRGEQRITGTELFIIALLCLVGGAIFWRYERAAEIARKPEPAVSAAPPRPAADQASVAVLPFVALSSGVDDGYFADGLSEEIINALSALPELLVTARTSSFHF